MTREELFDLHKVLCDAGRMLMEKKNVDYSNGGDPFHNFRMSTLLHVPPAKGVLIRMQDKISRIVSFLDRGDLKVKEESIRDTIVDLINYAVILEGMIEEAAANEVPQKHP